MRFPVVLRILSLTFVCCVAAGCAGVRVQDGRTLSGVYAERRQRPILEPVIFIPGLLGSTLEDSKGNIAWGRGGRKNLDELTLPMTAERLTDNRDGFIATESLAKYALIPHILEIELYSKIKSAAVDVAGYENDKTLYALSYDWRRDLVEGAQRLADLIDQIKLQHADPNLKVNLICHSTGGLIARYYAKYGREDVLDQNPLPEPTYAGAANLNKIIMLGTPNLGSLESFQNLHQGLSIPTIGRFSEEMMFSCPSTYEIFPHRNEPVFVDADGKQLDTDFYDPANWEKYGWSIFDPYHLKAVQSRLHWKNPSGAAAEYESYLDVRRRFLVKALNRAEKFHQALRKGRIQEERDKIRYILLGASCEPTLRRIILTPGPEGWKTITSTRSSRLLGVMYGYGDKSVTKESLLGLSHQNWNPLLPLTKTMPVDYSLFVCEDHTALAQSPTYINNVFHALLEDADE